MDGTADLLPAPDFAVDAGKLAPEDVRRLLGFNREYQNRVLAYFAEIRREFERRHPGRRFAGAFGEVDSISGLMRGPDEARAWSWGDCRGLGVWSYFLRKDVVPDSLRGFYSNYVDFIHGALVERRRLNHGELPFLVDPASNLASADPRNIPTSPGRHEPTVVFAAAAFLQYALLRDDPEAAATGLDYLEKAIDCGVNHRNVDHITKQVSPNHAQGFMMVTVGAIVDTLKCAAAVPDGRGKGWIETLPDKAAALVRLILDKHHDPASGAFWESVRPDGQPLPDASGRLLCDPGHSAEFCGFAAELCAFLPDNGLKSELLAALPRIVAFIDANGYSPAGALYKSVDARGAGGIPDRVGDGGRAYKTAPWWNLRELAAAALKLHQLTGDPGCLRAYRRAFQATYRHYPNQRIGGLMFQTLDAETLEPLPFHPATGNLDPMHCPRAREREIEALELLPG